MFFFFSTSYPRTKNKEQLQSYHLNNVAVAVAVYHLRDYKSTVLERDKYMLGKHDDGLGQCKKLFLRTIVIVDEVLRHGCFFEGS
jgi:hypothetical protein